MPTTTRKTAATQSTTTASSADKSPPASCGSTSIRSKAAAQPVVQPSKSTAGSLKAPTSCASTTQSKAAAQLVVQPSKSTAGSPKAPPAPCASTTRRKAAAQPVVRPSESTAGSSKVSPVSCAATRSKAQPVVHPFKKFGRNPHIKKMKATCYNCDEQVAGSLALTHLFFGPIKCTDCTLVIAWCCDFQESSQSTQKCANGSTHNFAEWKDQPWEFLQYFAHRELSISKFCTAPQGSTEYKTELASSITSYLEALSPLKDIPPWSTVLNSPHIPAGLNALKAVAQTPRMAYLNTAMKLNFRAQRQKNSLMVCLPAQATGAQVNATPRVLGQGNTGPSQQPRGPQNSTAFLAKGSSSTGPNRSAPEKGQQHQQPSPQKRQLQNGTTASGQGSTEPPLKKQKLQPPQQTHPQNATTASAQGGAGITTSLTRKQSLQPTQQAKEPQRATTVSAQGSARLTAPPLMKQQQQPSPQKRQLQNNTTTAPTLAPPPKKMLQPSQQTPQSTTREEKQDQPPQKSRQLQNTAQATAGTSHLKKQEQQNTAKSVLSPGSTKFVRILLAKKEPLSPQRPRPLQNTTTAVSLKDSKEVIRSSPKKPQLPKLQILNTPRQLPNAPTRLTNGSTLPPIKQEQPRNQRPLDKTKQPTTETPPLKKQDQPRNQRPLERTTETPPQKKQQQLPQKSRQLQNTTQPTTGTPPLKKQQQLQQKSRQPQNSSETPPLKKQQQLQQKSQQPQPTTEIPPLKKQQQTPQKSRQPQNTKTVSSQGSKKLVTSEGNKDRLPPQKTKQLQNSTAAKKVCVVKPVARRAEEGTARNKGNSVTKPKPVKQRASCLPMAKRKESVDLATPPSWYSDFIPSKVLASGNYLVILHPTQTCPDECPKCYFSFYPEMAVVNLATCVTDLMCPECHLIVYLVPKAYYD